MLINRTDRDHHTEIVIWNEGDVPAYQGYRITCMDVDWDRATGTRQPPTAHISLLCSTSADVAQARRLAAEYTYVADVAEALQAEKRAKWEK